MKYKLPIYIIIFLPFILFSCNNSQENNKNDFFDSINVDIKDTLSKIDSTGIIINEEKINSVEGRNIIFFMPTSKEKNEILKHHGMYTKYDFQSIYNDFELLARNTRKIVSNQNISLEISTANKFEIKMDTGIIVYNRNKEEEIIGIIFSDGKQQPYFLFGLYNYSDLKDSVQKFFKIKEIQNVQPDSI